MTPARATPSGTDTVSGTPPVPAVSIAYEWSESDGIGGMLPSFVQGLPVAAASPRMSAPDSREPVDWNEKASSQTRLLTASG